MLVYIHGFYQEKIQSTSHNALLPIGLFCTGGPAGKKIVQVVIWGDSDETYLNKELIPILHFRHVSSL